MKHFKGYYFDLDGTVYAGNKLMEGASELLKALRQNNKKIVFMTNNSTLNGTNIARKLQSLSVPTHPNQIVCPTDVAGDYILEYYGHSSVYVIGSNHLTDSVVKAGHTIKEDTCEACDLVLVGRDLHFTYQKMEDAVIHLQRGAKLIATNMDATHPIHNGERVPETGSIVAAIQRAYAVDPDVIGKPSSYLFDQALERVKLQSDQAVMIGDNPSTDMKGGRNAGLATVLIGQDQTTSDIVVDYAFENLLQLKNAIYSEL
ncbi:HAD-IIA family hydrolase [Pseudalkalibacillus berkeleyi]|uniref:Acid sugar phosphatase n=1 Tax=Pseudalkalibacillus berkeleyi TaxID=1069813 RepID=A0ABS9GYL5_9BACL|nr:HAD-IIA family hydrolase [Pseudalkalibacillus berkeleyi]MCF6136627.1 HAD-IIA family hydrolase [Pseudalkalibacillus berkeleyi]